MILKKVCSILFILSVFIGTLPLAALAETAEDSILAVESVELTDEQGRQISSDNRLAKDASLNVGLNWTMKDGQLIEEGTQIAMALPKNLTYEEQSGTIDQVGSYQVANQQLIVTFKQNYVLDEIGQVSDFASIVRYHGSVLLKAYPTAVNQSEDILDFGNGIVKQLYFSDETSASMVEPLETALPEKSPRAHEPNLNTRGVKLFNGMKVTDFNDQEFSDTYPATQNANIKIHFDWSLLDDEEILAGDYYTYQLPEYFSVHNPVSEELVNSSGAVLGAFTLGFDGKLVVTFNENAQNLSQRQGTIDLRTELNIVTEEEVVEIVTGIENEDSESITIKIPILKAEISKQGMLEKNNVVTWTLLINESGRELKRPYIRDFIPEGLTSWYTSTYVLNENQEWVAAPANFLSGWIESDGSYVATPTSGVLNQPIKIVLHTNIVDQMKTSFYNRATITGDNFIENAAEASVDYDNLDNYKHHTSVDVNTGVITWELKATFTQENGELKDWMYNRWGSADSAHHYLLQNTLQVQDEAGNPVPASDWSISSTEGDFQQKNGEYVHFTLKFKHAGVYKIFYSTQSFDVPAPLGRDYLNQALFIDGSTREETSSTVKTDVDQSVGVGKKAVSKDYANNTIDWEVTVNSKRVLMKNTVITDKFENLAGANKSALQLMEDSLVLVANSEGVTATLVQGQDYLLEKLAGDDEYLTGFVIRLIGSYATTQAELTLTYKTKYNLENQPPASNGVVLRFDNSTVVTYVGSDDKKHTDGTQTATWVPVDYAKNGVKYGKYLKKDEPVAGAFSHANPFEEQTAAENSTYWSVVFNTWQSNIPKNSVIQDFLGDGQTLKEVTIYDAELHSSRVQVGQLGEKWIAGQDYTYEMDNGVPKITLLKATNKVLAVFVSAKAADEQADYTNRATLTMPDQEPLEVAATVEKSDSDRWIDKSGKQGTGDDYRLVDWSIVLNKDAHRMIDPKVVDTVKINEQSFVYDEQGQVVVSVYPAKTTDGTHFEKDGPALVFTEENRPTVSMDFVKGEQTLTIDLGAEINSPYIVEYRTAIDPGVLNNETISNRATLSGKGLEYHTTQSQVTVKSTDGEGTSSGKNGVLKFRKVDEDNQLITNGSAFFNLYHRSDSGELTLLLSDIEVRGDQILQAGQPVEQISNLCYGEYSLIENQAPDGYLLDNSQYDFTLSNESSEYTFTLENKKQETKTTSAVIAAEKILTGRKLQADEFSFNLKDSQDQTLQTKRNAADGTITFDPITYDAPGVHTYKLSEATPTTPEAGMTYDETVYEVTVTVTENDGQLEAKVDYQQGKEPNFTNVYNPEKQVRPADIKLQAKKVLTGRKLLADEFSFELVGIGNNTKQTKKNAADGAIDFDPLHYTKAGVYKYTMSEVIPEKKVTGVTYDKTKYEVTVTVTEKAGQLKATVNYQNNTAVPTFTNEFVSPSSQPVKKQPIPVNKKVLNEILPKAGDEISGVLAVLGCLLLGVILIIVKKRQVSDK
ncbi:Spy0128 family protein [Enterococcus sp. UD-01]|jgi:pilin isopeptide linkage protein/LPXTG-motif cell wall-anchored protein|uniref:Spy0128 family protein n=1 Tax=Enterococcus sp. UD-01 TaxID=3373911 RepID=UPI003835E031